VHELIAWAGFVGAWFLVAGPVYQAALELEEESFEREEFTEVAQTLGPPPRTSPWWWLLPPVAYVLRRRRGREWRRTVMHAMSRPQIEQWVRFANTANGWLYVALGGLLIATKETWELREAYEWPVAVFWVALPVMALVCAANTAVRIARGHGLLAEHAAAQA
jgi:hypothetical protein